MRGARVAMGASLGAIILGCVALGQAQDVKVTNSDRLWENFRRENAVVNAGQFRLELEGITLQANRSSDGPQVLIRGTPPGEVSQNQILTNLESVSGGQVGLIGSYGLFTNTEVGIQIQGVFQGLRFFNTNNPGTTVGGQVENANTFGDMWLYGKYQYPVNDELGVGGGVEVRLPTGNAGERTGTGETGTNPFVNVRYLMDRWAVGAHAGYQFNTGDLDDMFNWSADGVIRVSKLWGIRAEFTGWNYDYGGDSINNVYCNPGIEYNFSDNIIVRPEGQVGITKPALGWGIGVGVAYTF